MVSVPARRSQVAFATGRGLSQRRACTLVKVGRSALRYRSRKAEKDAPVLARMSELAAQYPRYGYRRVRIFTSFCAGRVMRWDRSERIGSGAVPDCYYRGGDPGGGWPLHVRVHCRP
jgi:putative transposase